MSPNPRRAETKILTPAALVRRLALLRRKRPKPRIVFTNGIFDLLHAGHVTYLAQARKLGTQLIVALNSDESTRKLKGPTRPVNALADRMRVIAALECVDFVTHFGEETPRALIELLKPEVLVKGGDYQANQIAGAAEIKAWGGKVKILPFLEGRSTTAMLSRGAATKGS